MDPKPFKIPYSVARITHLGGYWERVTEIMQEGATNFEAWSKIETELLEYGFPARYTSADSFREAKCRMRTVLKDWRPQKAFLLGYLPECKTT